MNWSWYEFFEAAFCVGLFLLACIMLAGVLTGRGPFAVFM